MTYCLSLFLLLSFLWCATQGVLDQLRKLLDTSLLGLPDHIDRLSTVFVSVRETGTECLSLRKLGNVADLNVLLLFSFLGR